MSRVETRENEAEGYVMRKILVKIECGKKRCKWCVALSTDEIYCDAFAKVLNKPSNSIRSPKRLKACKKAEKKAKKLIKKGRK